MKRNTNKLKLSCDFETNNHEDDCHVWGACATNIMTNEIEFLGNSLEAFIDYLSITNCDAYFHNLKFDGTFIIDYLCRNGYTFTPDRPHEEKTFNCVISEMGQYYCIEIAHKSKGRKIVKNTIYDSLKKLPMSVRELAKAFNLEIKKGEIDYNKPRPVGYIMTKEEEEYLINDCQIVGQCLKHQFNQGLTKMTIGSDALNSFKASLPHGEDDFIKWFPVLDLQLDDFFRQAYKGGICWVNPKFKDKKMGAGLCYDANSMYPWALYYKKLPFGYPLEFEKSYEYDKNYPLYFIRIRAMFDLKKGYMPTIQLKKNLRHLETEYVTSTNGHIEEMILTSVDYELFKERYEIHYLEERGGFKFRQCCGAFKAYIDKWMEIKANSKGALRTLAKLMLNSLYGKFASQPYRINKIPYLDEETNKIKFELSDIEIIDPVYTPLACFVTAYARQNIVHTAEANFERFCYCDTDSVHLIGKEIPDNIDIHDSRLGAWKLECKYKECKYLRAKTYIESYYLKTKHIKASKSRYKLHENYRKLNKNLVKMYHLDVKCAGMPSNVKKSVTYDNFHSSSVFGGKLLPKIVPGGTILKDTEFTIK